MSGVFRISLCIILIFTVILGNGTAQLNNSSAWIYESGKEISDLSVSADGSSIIGGGEKIFSLSKGGQQIWSEWFCDKIAVSADGEFFVYSYRSQLILKDINNLKIWEKEIGTITAIAISPDGSRIVASDIGCNIYFFDRSGELLSELIIRYGSNPQVHDIKFSGDGKNVIAVTDNGFYYFSRDGILKFKREDSSGKYGGSSVAISSDGSIFVCGNEHQVEYFKGATRIWENNLHTQITGVAISSDGSKIAVGSRDNAVHFFDKNGKELWKHETGFWISDIAISSDGSVVVAGSMDNHLYILGSDGSVLSTIDAKSWVEHVYINSDGTFAIAASKYAVLGIPIKSSDDATERSVNDASLQNAGNLAAPTSPAISNASVLNPSVSSDNRITLSNILSIFISIISNNELMHKIILPVVFIAFFGWILWKIRIR